MGGKVCLMCFEKKRLYTSRKFSHPHFEFSPKVKVMGSNPGYLLKSFLLYKKVPKTQMMWVLKYVYILRQARNVFALLFTKVVATFPGGLATVRNSRYFRALYLAHSLLNFDIYLATISTRYTSRVCSAKKCTFKI